MLPIIMVFLKAFFVERPSLAAENMALRHQLTVLQRSVKRPKLRKPDRIFWIWLSRLWTGWRSALFIVQPETVKRHRQGFRLYWRWRSRREQGRPTVGREVRGLIRRMSGESPTWGAPRILSELLLLGYDVAQSTVARYMVRHPRPPSQTWRSFIKDHMAQTAAIDLFAVPTITFRVFYCFLMLRHHRRQVVHFNIAPNPTAQWTARQVMQAFPYDSAPRLLVRDRDCGYDGILRHRVENTGIEEILTACRSTSQNPYAERLIGSIRRDCLDHVVVLNEDHLRRIPTEYSRCYHQARAHPSLDRNSPIPRAVHSPQDRKVMARPHLGGLHHCYTRAA